MKTFEDAMERARTLVERNRRVVCVVQHGDIFDVSSELNSGALVVMEPLRSEIIVTDRRWRFDHPSLGGGG